MGGTAAVVSAITAVVGAGGAVYKSVEAAKDRERAQDQLRKERKDAKQLHKERTKRLMGQQLAAFGASGVRVGEGTPMDVLDDTRTEAKKERDAIMKGYKYQSDILDRERNRLLIGGGMEAGGSLLTGAAGFASNPYGQQMWDKYNPFSSTGGSSRPYIPAV